MPCAVAALTVAQWQGGQLAAGTFTIEVSYYAVLPFAVLLLIDRLDRAASHALRALRPLLGIDDAALEDIHYRLTVAPARPAGLLAAIAAVLTAAGYVADPVSSGLIGMPLVGLVFRVRLGIPDHGDLRRARLSHAAPASPHRDGPRTHPPV